MTDSPLARAKDRLTISDLGAKFFPGWRAGKSCHSPFREDRHPSFSVFADGREWKDHGTGDHGDAVDFIAKARGCDKGTAARELIVIASTGRTTGPRCRLPASQSGTRPTQATGEPSRSITPPMPATCREIWAEGLAHLRGSANLQDRIDEWRSWPPGTTCTLAADGLMGCPRMHGRRATGFAVQSPFFDDLGFVSTCDIGFHVRHKPADAQTRPAWEYFPSEKKHGARCPALPFVVGGGFVPFARTIIVTEGQFDGVTLAGAAGWLASDASWPEDVALFAARGAAAWRPLIDEWARYWRPEARFVLFADADEAGSTWRAPGGFVDTLRRRGHPVRLLRSNATGAKDINDLHRAQPLTPEIVAAWIAMREEAART